VSGNHVHQIRAQTIITLQPLLLELTSNIAHLLRIKALLNNAAHKRRKLRLLPPVLRITKLAVHEIQPLERMIDLDAAKHVHAAVLARVALDHGRRVDDSELVGVGRDAELLSGNDADDGEERAVGFPALCTAARVVESDVRVESDFYGLRGAFAAKLAAGAIVCLLLDAAVDGGVEGGHGWLRGAGFVGEIERCEKTERRMKDGG
jgi:hypothetical protein